MFERKINDYIKERKVKRKGKPLIIRGAHNQPGLIASTAAA
jgi:hypothetical protein